MPDPKFADCDRLFSEYKALSAFMPPWGKPGTGKSREWQLRWPVLDNLTIGVGYIAIECNASQDRYSFCLILLQKPLHRLDIVPECECKDNPFAARKVVPPVPETVNGPHTHSWLHNREWCILNGLGELPIRAPVARPPSFAHALAAFAEQTNIVLEHGQRQVELPPQAGLFTNDAGGR
jgi:hypothetical protein